MAKNVVKGAHMRKRPEVVNPVENPVIVEENVEAETEIENVEEVNEENIEEEDTTTEDNSMELVQELSPEEIRFYTNGNIRRYLTFQFIDNFTALLNREKMQLVYSIINLFPEEMRNDIVDYASNVNSNIMIESYESIEMNTAENCILSKQNAILYHTLVAAKESANGFKDHSIGYEIISLPSYGNRTIIVYREEELMKIGARDEVLKAADPKCIAAIALTPSHVNNTLINLFISHLCIWIPQLNKGDESINGEEILSQYINQYGGMIIGYILLAMERTYSMIVNNVGGEFAAIAGEDYGAKYSYHCDINSTSQDAISMISIFYEGTSGNKLLDAIRNQ